jgi:hypothetical protein
MTSTCQLAGVGELACLTESPVVYFTVVADYSSAAPESQVSGLVTFTPRLLRGEILFTSANNGIFVPVTVGVLRNGVLYDIGSGTPGVQLVANFAELNVTTLVYDVTFEVTVDDAYCFWAPFAFPAPAGGTVCLTSPALAVIPYAPPNSTVWRPDVGEGYPVPLRGGAW